MPDKWLLCIIALLIPLAAAADVGAALSISGEAALAAPLTIWDDLHSAIAEEGPLFHVLVICYSASHDGIVSLASLAKELHRRPLNRVMVTAAVPNRYHYLFEGSGIRIVPMCDSPFMHRTTIPSLMEEWSIEGDLAAEVLYEVTVHIIRALKTQNEAPTLLLADSTAHGAISAAELERVRFALNHAHTLSGARSRFSRALTPWTLPVLGSSLTGAVATAANSLLRSFLLVEDFMFVALNTNGHRKKGNLPLVSTSMDYTDNACLVVVDSFFPLELPRIFQLPFLLVGPVGFRPDTDCSLESTLPYRNDEFALLVDVGHPSIAENLLSGLPPDVMPIFVNVHDNHPFREQYSLLGNIMSDSSCAVAPHFEKVAILMECDLSRTGQAITAGLPLFCIPDSMIDVSLHLADFGAATMVSSSSDLAAFLTNPELLSAMRTKSRVLRQAYSQAGGLRIGADLIQSCLYGYPKRVTKEKLGTQNGLVFEYSFQAERHEIGTLANGLAIYLTCIVSFASLVMCSLCCCCCCCGKLCPCVRSPQKHKLE